MLRWCFLIGATSLGVGLVGCGGNEFPVAAVSGVVTVEGQPLSGGRVALSPIGDGEVGPGAIGDINLDGTFTLGTYSDADGAVVGKHRVDVLPPYMPDEETDGEQAAAVSVTRFVPPRDLAFDVKDSGENQLTIELDPDNRRRRPGEEELDD